MQVRVCDPTTGVSNAPCGNICMASSAAMTSAAFDSDGRTVQV